MVCIGSTLRFMHRSKFGTGDADGVHISVQRKFRVSRQMPQAFRESFDFTTEHHGKCPAVADVTWAAFQRHEQIPVPRPRPYQQCTWITHGLLMQRGQHPRDLILSTVKYRRRATVDFVGVARCCEWTDNFYSSRLYLCLFRIYPYPVSIEQIETETTSALAFGAFLQGRCSWR